MKGLLLILITIGFYYGYPFLHAEFVSDVDNKVAGSVEGSVVLAAKEISARFGNRYGRPSQSTSSSLSAEDSVLVWLESSEMVDAAPQDHVVLDQKDLKFNPSLLPVRQHGSVRIRNSDPVYHNVFSLSSNKKFHAGYRPKGEYLDINFDKPGIVDVFCDIHSNMRAVIYIMPSNVLTWTKIKSGDTFTFTNISPGSYELKAYALGYQEQSVAVEVISGETTNTGTLTLNF